MGSMADDRDELPADAWPYWPVALAGGGEVDVLGAGPCHAPFAVARTLPRGGWHRAGSPAEAIAAASGVSVEQARAAFLAEPGP
jgi:hypothetical protein